jgi:hypothetical protein
MQSTTSHTAEGVSTAIAHREAKPRLAAIGIWLEHSAHIEQSIPVNSTATMKINGILRWRDDE